MRIHRIPGVIALAAVSLLLSSALRASEEVVELPTLTVTDTRDLPQPEKWRYTTLEGFEVISSASDRETRRLLRDFEIFRLALGIVWPLPQNNPPPSAMILCGRNGEFASFLSPEEKKTHSRASLVLNNREQAFVILDLHSRTVLLNAESVDIAGDEPMPSEFRIDHYKQLYREYLRYLFSLAQNPPPVWFEEGLSQIIMAMEFSSRLITIGRIQPGNEISIEKAWANAQNAAAAEAEDTQAMIAVAPVEDVDFNVALNRKRLLSFDEFFGVKADSPAARSRLGNNLWAKQCYAFAHMCLYGRKGRYEAAFNKLVERASREPLTPEIFEECFGKPYNKFLVELRGYISFTDYTYRQTKITGERTLDVPPPEMRDATEGEAMRIKGDAWRLSGQPARARDALVAAYIRGERDPAFLSTLGQAELAAGNTDRARRFLEVSVPKSPRGSVFVDLARLRLDAAIAQPAGPDGKLSDAQLRRVLKPLFDARALPAVSADLYTMIAEAWLAAYTMPSSDHLAVLTEGVQRFPRSTALIYAVARLHARAGNTAAVNALAMHGEKISRDDETRARFTALKADPSNNSH
jgi:hypothetical protein